MSTIWQTTNSIRDNLSSDIKTLLDAASAADWLGPKEAPVLLKPNLVVSKPSAGGATTTPEVTGGIIEYLSDLGYLNITIAEGSWVGDSTAKAFKLCGYTALARRYGIKLIDLQKDSAETRIVDGEEYRVCRTIAELDENGGSLINIPVLKGHGQTHLTCALKNLKGCIPDAEKRRYHSLGVHRPVAMLNTIIKPAFTLVDGLNGDPYWEEGGSPEKRDLLLLGRDSVSIDSYACGLLGIPLKDVTYIDIARNLGVGETSDNHDIINLSSFPGTAKQPSSGEMVHTKKWIGAVTDQRSACSACFGNLAGALCELRSENHAAQLFGDNSICIGQDFKNIELPSGKIGIGSCTSGRLTIRGCPPSLAAIKKFLSPLQQ